MLKSKIEKVSDREYIPVNILNIYESISEYENFISKSVVKKNMTKKRVKIILILSKKAFFFLKIISQQT